jgi:hypothetical protein
MANIKWSGIEQSKYGLTAKWYVSAYYGNDNDVDGVGLYNSSTNALGHGGPTRPFATLDKLYQQSVGTTILDSGYYKATTGITNGFNLVGDGNIIIEGDYLSGGYATATWYNIFAQNVQSPSRAITLVDSFFCYGKIQLKESYKSIILESHVGGATTIATKISNCAFIRCSNTTGSAIYPIANIENTLFYDCYGLYIRLANPRPTGTFLDYSILIGKISVVGTTINGKSTNITLEDFKTDGNYFVKSYSEVDLWGNASGSGASVVQLQELFCNYFSPIYIDTWNEANFHIKATAPDILKYGGLNGTYIGAKPIMHWFSSESLWDTYLDATNTTDLETDAISKAIVISGAAESGTYRSIRISLPKPITANVAKFAANLVYNIEGTVKQGVSNQRIDTTPDLLPDNTANQRVVYDFKLSTAPNNVDALSAFKNYELDREPTVDSQGRSHLDDNFDSATETKQTVQDFMIEFTLRKVVIA